MKTGNVAVEQHLAVVGGEATVRLIWVNDANIPWGDGGDRTVGETDMWDVRVNLRSS